MSVWQHSSYCAFPSYTIHNHPPKTVVLQQSYPVSDFWQISSCSSKCGSSCPIISSPMQHWTTLGVSWARVMILTQDLSMLEKRFASCWNMTTNVEGKRWRKKERRGKRHLLVELAPSNLTGNLLTSNPMSNFWRFLSLEKHKSFCVYNTAYFILDCQACLSTFSFNNFLRKRQKTHYAWIACFNFEDFFLKTKVNF